MHFDVRRGPVSAYDDYIHIHITDGKKANHVEGMVRVLPQSAHGFFVDFNGRVNEVDFALDVKGRKVRGSCHVKITDEGVEFDGNPHFYDELPPTFKKAARGALIEFALDFSRAHPEVFIKAERKRLTDNAHRAMEKVKEAAKALHDAEVTFRKAEEERLYHIFQHGDDE